MKKTEVAHRLTVWASVLVMAMPATSLSAAGVAPHSPADVSTQDVALAADGSLRGRIVDSQGHARSFATMAVLRNGQVAARIVTDAQGRFAARGLSSGAYTVAIGNQSRSLRLWTEQTAPPVATRGLQLVSQAVVRGQCTTSCSDACESGCSDDACSGCSDGCTGCTSSCGAGCGGIGGGLLGGGSGLLSSPGLVAAGIISAVAIPVALSDDDDDDAPPASDLMAE